MKKLLIMIFAISPFTSATELYCEGVSWVSAGNAIKNSMVLLLEKDTGEVQAGTSSGAASGRLNKHPESYLGYIKSKSSNYLVNLNRFSGEILLVPVNPDKTFKELVEFQGVCEEREPKF